MPSPLKKSSETLKEHEKAFGEAMESNRVYLRESALDWLEGFATGVLATRDQVCITIAGLPGAGKGSLTKKMMERLEMISGGLVMIEMDAFMATRRGTPERDARLESTEALLTHLCNADEYRRVMSGIFEAGATGAKIPWGMRYKDGDFTDAGYLEVSEGKKIIISEGVLAGHLLPDITRDFEVPNCLLYAYGRPELTAQNAVLRDLEKGRITKDQIKPRSMERERELQLLIAEMTSVMASARLVVDGNERLEEKIKKRSGALKI